MSREKPIILVVDDEESFLEIMSTKLRSSGFDVALAHNGGEAFTEASKLMPDLILMDINIPGGTGTDAALAIKQNPTTKGLKIAFLTSMQDPWPSVHGDKEKLAQALGMEDFIQKTDDLDITVGKIREILKRE